MTKAGGLTRHQSRSTKTITWSVYTYEDQHNFRVISSWNIVDSNRRHLPLSTPGIVLGLHLISSKLIPIIRPLLEEPSAILVATIF
jgi:hypothetical protein